jgi:large subunit ribosomal protein L28
MFTAFVRKTLAYPASKYTSPIQPILATLSLQNGLNVFTGINTIEQQQVRHRSNRSRRGLYDGKDIRSGNNVSFSMRATKRTFKPNVFVKRVYSEILDGMIRFHLTASTLRSIDKAGGLDNYLLKNETITEGEGYIVKRKILKRLKNQARFERSNNTESIV